MASHDTGRPLPKFGEWDVNNPASAEGFTVIFSKARDQKMTNGPSESSTTSSSKPQNNFNDAPKKQQQKQQQQQQSIVAMKINAFVAKTTKGNLYLRRDSLFNRPSLISMFPPYFFFGSLHI